jgi:23S rRNA pseudouridine2605 synthase
MLVSDIWLAQYLARGGVASRRLAITLIKNGRVTLNKRVVDNPQTKVPLNAIVTLDGERVSAPDTPKLWKYHKPKGLMVTRHDPQGRPIVFDALPEELRHLQAVGRLDFNSEGLLLLTNHGGLARHLTLPKNGWKRRYKVRAFGTPTPDDLAPLCTGMTLEGIIMKADSATITSQQGRNVWLDIVLKEGKNREIRKLLDAINLPVSRLIRTSFGAVHLGGLEEGAVEEIPQKALVSMLGETVWQEISRG